jgi:hypothetical protein
VSYACERRTEWKRFSLLLDKPIEPPEKATTAGQMRTCDACRRACADGVEALAGLMAAAGRPPRQACLKLVWVEAQTRLLCSSGAEHNDERDPNLILGHRHAQWTPIDDGSGHSRRESTCCRISEKVGQSGESERFKRSCWSQATSDETLVIEKRTGASVPYLIVCNR